jgi:hypothetical protein
VCLDLDRPSHGRTYGRLLHILTFSGHELFPVILENAPSVKW